MSLDRMYLKAYGKINLALDVLRKREDGYHEVRMIMQTVGIYDGIEMVKTDSGKIEIDTNIYYLPTNENNIVYKAVRLLFDEFDIKSGIRISLNKFIPVSAGMAGGSSDAASVLFGINKMFDLKLSMKELMERGVKLGAEVPYCIMRGTALSEGIGEKLKRLPDMVKCPVLIAKPHISVSTKFVYENLRADELVSHPDIDGMITAIKNQDLHGIASKMENVLETVTIKEYPQIDDIKKAMIKENALNSLMSGSGPTVFGLFEHETDAYAAKERIKSQNYAKQVYVTDIFLPQRSR
ncbi:MAG: 4-(cytidine 5'-diphospho)-2-C-methyl-D-erythritol kinase [Lachnospiraceae bacterium]|nr:4-(cytidine 5'-diphospho)-2-C-methyl-D-erythritol kinase [Lachnospiraceae bacterium]